MGNLGRRFIAERLDSRFFFLIVYPIQARKEFTSAVLCQNSGSFKVMPWEGGNGLKFQIKRNGRFSSLLSFPSIPLWLQAPKFQYLHFPSHLFSRELWFLERKELSTYIFSGLNHPIIANTHPPSKAFSLHLICISENPVAYLRV